MAQSLQFGQAPTEASQDARESAPQCKRLRSGSISSASPRSGAWAARVRASSRIAKLLKDAPQSASVPVRVAARDEYAAFFAAGFSNGHCATDARICKCISWEEA